VAFKITHDLVDFDDDLIGLPFKAQWINSGIDHFPLPRPIIARDSAPKVRYQRNLGRFFARLCPAFQSIAPRSGA
jgi:hypothetical protein